MANQNVQIVDFSSVIEEILEEYGDLATDVIREESQAVGKKSVKELRNKSPKGATKKYSKGWKSQTVKTFNGAETTIYNDGHYQLTHLLENGHYLRNGQFLKGEEHIKPVNDEAQEEFLSNVEKRLKG